MKYCSEQLQSVMYRKKTNMKKLLALIPLFAFVACGDIDLHLGKYASASNCDGGAGSAGGSTECGPESLDGLRLKKQYIVGEDGSRAESGEWLDTKLGIVCEYQDTGIGTFCLPAHSAMNTYADPECIIPIYLVKSEHLECERLPMYVRFDSVSPSPNGQWCSVIVDSFRIYSANESKPRTLTNYWYTGKNGVCGGDSVTPGQYVAYDAHLIGTSEDFVKGSKP